MDNDEKLIRKAKARIGFRVHSVIYFIVCLALLYLIYLLILPAQIGGILSLVVGALVFSHFVLV